MSVVSQYYTCSNIDESVVFPKRQIVINNGSETGMRVIINYVPASQISNYIDCNNTELSWQQIERMLIFYDSEGNPCINLYQTI